MATGNELTATKRAATREGVAPEDEDLFDFPVVELVRKGETPREPRTVGSIAAPPAPAAAASASAWPKAASAPASARPAVESAAELIDGLEEVLEEELEQSHLARPDARRSVPSVSGASPMALLGGMLLLNLLTFGFFWYTSQNFRTGLEALREDLVFATNTNRTAQAPIRAATPEVGIDPAPESNAAAKPAPAAKRDVTVESTLPSHPLDAFERTTLELARTEIADGEVMAARKRLHRLLAIADRMEPEVAKDVEARARFLIAESYRSQASTKELHQREAAKADKARAKEPSTGPKTEKAQVD